MNAQGQWALYFELFMCAKTHIQRTGYRNSMYGTRREAALERKLEAAQRKIEALEETLKDIATAPYEIQPNDGNEWEKEYYSRGLR